ncbi:hypothetical protein [Streptomyces sp. NPDC014894]|uniref:hypothetical protein n=1 Tax=unclassified Streptomyces TaxID=2593676 RepID=UPI0036FD13A0
MGPMRRGLVHAMAWSLATGAAVTLTWWGVHTVMSGTAYDRPLAVEIDTEPETKEPTKEQGSSTKRPPSPTSKPSAQPPVSSPGPSSQAVPEPSATASKSASVAGEKTPMASGSPQTAKSAGTVKSYTVDGGRVVFDLGEKSAELVSATPNAGWQMDVWKQDFWIRVTFTKDGREVSAYCTWHGGRPTVVFDDR